MPKFFIQDSISSTTLRNNHQSFLGLDEPIWKKFLIQWMGLSLIFHIITAYFSIGHHSADEYFQILEFLSFKLGKTPAHHLPTEFREHMRPWLQPWMYWCVTRLWQFLGIYNPFTWAMTYREISGIIGWLSTFLMAVCSRFWFDDPKIRKFAVLSLALIWFFPVLHARPSSENLGGSTFLIALCLMTLGGRFHSQWKYKSLVSIISGILLGFSFEFRFQMGLMIAGFLAWIFIFGQKKYHLNVRQFAFIILGLALSFGLGRAIDYWGYGQWVFSPWNYCEFNLIRGEVSKYGTAPWWDIFRMSMTETWPILGFLLAMATVVAWIRHPLHILTWSQIPFFLVHEMIAHKEGRFYFPIGLAGPILLALSIYFPSGYFSSNSRSWPKIFGSKIYTILIWVWKFLVFNNLIALFALMFLPFARTVQFYQGVYENIPPGTREFKLYTLDRDPYILLGNPIFFFRPLQLTVHKTSSYLELKETILRETQSEPLWLFDTHFRLPDTAQVIAPYCEVVYQIFPPQIEKFNWGNWLERTLTWTLYRCQAGTYKK